MTRRGRRQSEIDRDAAGYVRKLGFRCARMAVDGVMDFCTMRRDAVGVAAQRRILIAIDVLEGKGPPVSRLH